MNSIDVACEVEEDNSEVVVAKPQKKRGRSEGEGKGKQKKIPAPIVLNLWRTILDRDENDLNLLCGNEYGAYVEDELGARTPVCINAYQRTIRRVSVDMLAGDLLRVSMTLLSRGDDHAGFALTPKRAVESVQNWIATTKFVFQDLNAVAFKSTPGWSFSRLEFDPFSCIEDLTMAPSFAEIGIRMDNFEAFCAWVWSLFVPTSDRRQYIWLHGDGQTGKSQIAEALSRVLGGAVTTANPKVCQRDNWTYSLLSKRLCVLTEANPEFPLSDMFKSITGDERHRVNEKYLKPFDATIDTKFLFISNDELSITSDVAAMSRAILCKLRPFKGEMLSPREYQEKLADEMPMFLGYCKYMYEKINKNGSIPCDVSELEALSEEREFKFHNIFECYFRHAPGMRTPIKKVQTILGRNGFDKEYKQFKAWMERRLGITNKQVWLKDKTQRCFVDLDIISTYRGVPGEEQADNVISLDESKRNKEVT